MRINRKPDSASLAYSAQRFGRAGLEGSTQLVKSVPVRFAELEETSVGLRDPNVHQFLFGHRSQPTLTEQVRPPQQACYECRRAAIWNPGKHTRLLHVGASGPCRRCRKDPAWNAAEGALRRREGSGGRLLAAVVTRECGEQRRAGLAAAGRMGSDEF